MTLRKVVIALTFIAVFAMGLRISVDTDTWWHLRTGDWIRETGSVPLEDPFSFTQTGADWRYPSAAWISQIVMSWLFERAGPAGLNLGVAATVTVALALMYPVTSGGSFQRAFLLVLSAATSAVFWSARPHLATYLFFAALLLILEKWRVGRPRLLWWLPAIMLVWVNSHPGFAAGFVLFGIYLVAELIDLVAANQVGTLRKGLKESVIPQMLLVGLLMILAVMLNPSGPAMLSYPFETLSIGVLRDSIQEWQSPNFHDAVNLPFLFTVLFSLLILGRSRRTISLTDALLLTIFGAMAFLAGRNVPLFALISAPILSSNLAGIVEDWQARGLMRLELDRPPNRSQSILNIGIVTLALLAVAAKATLVLPSATNQAAFEERFPVAAAEFILDEGLPGPIFNSYNFGGYLIWAVPDLPVFIDGRTDLYADGSLEQWLQIAAAEEGWQQQLAHHDIQLILIEDFWPLAHRLEAAGWDKIYADEIAVVFVHQ